MELVLYDVVPSITIRIVRFNSSDGKRLLLICLLFFKQVLHLSFHAIRTIITCGRNRPESQRETKMYTKRG